MLVKMTKEGQEALLQLGTESHVAYLNAGWVHSEVVTEDAEVQPIGEAEAEAEVAPEVAPETEVVVAPEAVVTPEAAPTTRRTRG